MKCPFVSHLTNVNLKSTFSDISIATPACFGGIDLVNLLLAFHYKPVFISVNKMGMFAKWCLLMGELSPLTLSVNIDRYVVIPAIYLFLLLLFKDLSVCS
jgi:hypothetical protein